MTTLTITDLPLKESRRETFLNGEFSVRSRSGLHPVEIALIESMPKYAQRKRHLVTGNRTGVLPLALSAFPGGREIVAHGFDIHHVRAIARNFSENGAPVSRDFPREPFAIACDGNGEITGGRLNLNCGPALPDGPFDVVWIMASATNTAAEVVQEWFEQAHGVLADGGMCVVATDGQVAWTQEQMKRVFGKVSAFPPCGGARVLAAKKSAPIRKRHDFSAAFEASLPDGLPPLAMKTIPGVFAHRRPDAGGLALAEVARDRVKPGDRLLDLGCGCGLVGLLLARHIGAEGRVSLVDSDSRAFACTVANAKANGLFERCEVVLNDEGYGGGPVFDVVVGNPPYYSDYSIAGRFIAEAGYVLKPGGLALIVARDARRHAELLEEFVGPATIENRRGYQVAIATRRSRDD